MQVAREPPQDARSAEISGQRTHPDKSFPKHHASSCRDCLWDRLHEPHGPFLLGWRTHVVGVVSSSFSCFSILARTCSLVSYPTAVHTKIDLCERINTRKKRRVNVEKA